MTYPWSERYDETLRRLYAKLGPHVLAERFGATPRVVRYHANKIGVVMRPRGIKWNSELDDYIRAHYNADRTSEEIAEHLSKEYNLVISRKAIIGRAYRLGLSERRPL